MKTKIKRVFFAITLLTTSFSVIGCGPKKPDGLPELHPTTLTLTQDGAPLTDATVILNSQALGTWSCGGTSDADGVVVLRTHGQYDGAPLGKHKVLVVKTASQGGETPETPPQGEFDITAYRQAEAERMANQNSRDYGEMINYVEERFGNALETPLEIEVVDGKNRFELDCGPAIEEAVENASPM